MVPARPPQRIVPSQERTNNWLPPAKTVDPSDANLTLVNEPSAGGDSVQACPRPVAETVPILMVKRNATVTRYFQDWFFMFFPENRVQLFGIICLWMKCRKSFFIMVQEVLA